MASRNRLQVKGPNAIRDIQKRMNDVAVSVGVHASAGKHKESDGGLTVAQVYGFNEFGTERIPERPTLRPTMRTQRQKYIGVMRTITLKAMTLQSYDIRIQMGKLGQLAQNDVQKAIRDLDSPPNKDSTIKAKGSSNPLIDSTQMINSIRWEYVK